LFKSHEILTIQGRKSHWKSRKWTHFTHSQFRPKQYVKKSMPWMRTRNISANMEIYARKLTNSTYKTCWFMLGNRQTQPAKIYCWSHPFLKYIYLLLPLYIISYQNCHLKTRKNLFINNFVNMTLFIRNRKKQDCRSRIMEMLKSITELKDSSTAIKVRRKMENLQSDIG